MSAIRKPHNLVTAYWDDVEYFLQEAENAADGKGPTETDILFPAQKRGMRYAILSSFLFLEAFINAEYFDEMDFKKGPSSMTDIQKHHLDEVIINASFDEKWSTWVEDICQKGKQNLKGGKEFQELKTLKFWRNHLTHYKIHHLMVIAKDIETIENARKARLIAMQTISWYYHLTGKKIPDWIKRDILAF